MKGLIGKKVGMTQIFNDEGNAVPVTIIDVTSVEVVGKRTVENQNCPTACSMSRSSGKLAGLEIKQFACRS